MRRTRLELAYLGLEVPDPPSLDAVLRRGDRPRARASRPPAARSTWRNDDKAHRVIVAARPGQRRRVRRVRGGRRRRVRRASSTASRAAGFAVDRGHRRRPARLGGSQRLARTTTPVGRRRRARRRARPTPSTPFASPLMPGGFLTDGRRVRPRRVRHARRSTSRTAFLVDGLGLGAVRLAGDGDRRRASSWRCASTTATSATTPSRWPRRRSSCPRRCTTSCSRPTTATTSAPPSTGRGRPTSRSRTASAATTTTACSASTSPARPGSRSRSATAPASITDDWDDNRRYDRISAWGHQPLPPAR